MDRQTQAQQRRKNMGFIGKGGVVVLFQGQLLHGQTEGCGHFLQGFVPGFSIHAMADRLIPSLFAKSC